MFSDKSGDECHVHLPYYSKQNAQCLTNYKVRAIKVLNARHRRGTNPINFQRKISQEYHKTKLSSISNC